MDTKMRKCDYEKSLATYALVYAKDMIEFQFKQLLFHNPKYPPPPMACITDVLEFLKGGKNPVDKET